MKARRILALILSVAMVASPGNLAMDVHAMGNWAGTSFVAEETGASDGSDKVNAGAADDADMADSVSVTGNTDAAGDAKAAGGADAAGGAKAADGTDAAGGAKAADGADAAGDAKAADGTDAAGDAKAADGTDAAGDAKAAADSGNPGSTDADDVILEENDYFVVNGKGKLRMKAGVSLDSLAGTVTVPGKTRIIPVGIFNKNTRITGIIFPEGCELEEIEAGAFTGSAITSFALPDGVKELKAGTFKNSKLKDFTYSNKCSLEVIGEEAFADCDLTSVTIPGTVKTIGDFAFNSCSGLYSVQLTAVETIGDSAFKNCSTLQLIGWSKSLKAIGNSAFYGCGIKEIKDDAALGAGVTTWGTSVFERCTSLISVRLHKDTNQIPAGMFKDCTKLSTVIIPEACGVIKREAFYGCTALKKIIIPGKVSAIEADAFGGCSALATVEIQQKGIGGESDILLSQDAFPQKTGVTMSGYDGTVEDYANRKKYTFKTLFASYKVTIDVNKDEYGKAELSKNKARQGEIIEVKVTPAEGYRLKAKTFKFNDTNITKLKEEVEGSQIFTFVMPDERADVNVDFESASNSYGRLTPDFEQIDQMIFDWDKNKEVITFDKVGLACKLIVKGGKNHSDPGVWEIDFKSSRPKIVAIDSEGVIYARGKGTATITATLKSDTSKSIDYKIKVLEESEIDNYSLTFSNLGKAKLKREDIAGETLSVVQYTKDNLLGAERSFTVGLRATAGADTTNLFVQSSWESANTDMATLEEETVENNSNVVHVLKGVTGETAVTVTRTNGKTGKDKVVLYEESFIIRVIDATPRLVQSTLTVNSQSQLGTEFDLLSVYGYEVNPASLQIVEAVTKNKITNYEVTENAGYVTYEYADGKFRLKMSDSGKSYMADRANRTFTKMYIQGEYMYRTDSGDNVTETFRTPIKSLVLTKKALKPTVKCSGKINLFFNSAAGASERGQVTVTQSLKNLEVQDYKLVSEANYNDPGSEKVDSLANNFVISKSGVITRSDKELINDAKGKPVVKGYLEITYAGYDPCYAKIKIPTTTTKPKYVLSKTKATVNTYGNGYRMELQLLDKKTKKAIPLDSLNALSFDESASGTTLGLFEEMDTAAARESDKITLQIKKAQKGKAVINVEMDTWNEPMKFTFNLSVTGKIPVVKAKPAVITLNNLCVGRKAQTVLTLNQADSTLTAMEQVEYVGKDSLAYDASKISFQYVDGELSAWASEVISAGSYKFRFTPKVAYSNGQTENVKAVTITVKVIDTRLTAVLKPSSVTLNNHYIGRETGVYKYTIKNMPAGDRAEIVTTDAIITGKTQSAIDMQDAFNFTFGANEQTISVTQKQTVRRTGSYKYQISGLKTRVEGQLVDIQPFTITVKVINKAGKLTASAKGSLSIGNGSSSITYTLKVSNVSAKIEKIAITELDTTNSLNKPYDDGIQNFSIEEVRKDDGSIGSVIVRAKNGVALEPKRTYKIRIDMILPGAEPGQEEIIAGKVMNIKPKQTVPKVKTDVTSATLYAGVAADSPRRSQEILITVASGQTAEIGYVNIADSNSSYLKKAFRVVFNQQTQKAKITLVRPDMLKADTVYSLKLEVKYKGAMANGKGTQFTVNVKVIN